MLVSVPALASGQQVFIATETARGEYENGLFTRSYPQLQFRFEIDEKAGRATLTQISRLDMDSVINRSFDYQIVGVDEGVGLRASLASDSRRGQRVFILVGSPTALATETILLGERFFEYSKASSGRLYISSGTVRIQPGERR
jgi:hypothetical protein